MVREFSRIQFTGLGESRIERIKILVRRTVSPISHELFVKDILKLDLEVVKAIDLKGLGEILLYNCMNL